MKWRAYREEICFHSEFYSCDEYLLIFAKEKICSGRVAVESKIKRDAVDFVNSPGSL